MRPHNTFSNELGDDAQSAPVPTRKRHPVRNGILVVVGIIAVFILINVVLHFYDKSTLRGRLDREASIVLKNDMGALNKKHQKNLQEFYKLAGTVVRPEPVYSASYDICYADHNDSGWFVTNYNYACLLSRVDFFELTSENADAISAKLIHKDDEYNYGAVKYAWDLGYDSGVPIKNNYIFVTNPEVSSDARDFTTGYTLLFSSAEKEAYAARKIVNEAGSKSLDDKKQYLIFTDSEQYFTKDLGCARASVLFCDSPLGD